MSTLKEHQTVLLELLKEFDRVCKNNNINYMLFAGSALGAVRHNGFIPWDDDLDIALLREDYDKLMKIDASQWNEAYYMQNEFSNHWPLHFSKLRKNNTTCLEKYHPKDNQIHQGIYIDVFPIDNISDNKFIRRLQFYASRIVVAKTKFAQGYETKSLLKKTVMFCCRILPLKPFYNLATMKKNKNTKSVHSYFGGSIRYSKGIFSREWFAETVNMEFEDMVAPVSKCYHEMLSKQYGDYMTLPPEEDRKCKVHAILVDTEKNYTEYEHYRDGMEFEILTRSIR